MNQLREIIQAMKPENLAEPVYKCEKCNDTGFVNWTDDNGIEYAKECTCKIKARNMQRLERSGLMNQIERYTFKRFKPDTPYQEEMLRKACEYVKNQYLTGKWFYIGGQSGCGKTHLCTAIVAQIIKQGHSAKYMLWREESTHLKGLVNSEEYNSEIDKFKKTYCLYIDDLFKGSRSDADIKLAFELIDARYRQKLPTVISSECITQELASVDEAIAGRIRERSAILNIGKDEKKNYRINKVPW